MSDTNQGTINQAIHACLERCYQTGQPLLELAKFLEELTASGWNPNDIRTLELAVLRLLRGVQKGDPPDGGASNFSAGQCQVG